MHISFYLNIFVVTNVVTTNVVTTNDTGTNVTGTIILKIEEEIKQKKFKTKYHKTYFNLLYTHYKLQSISADIFKQFDISQPQYNVLRILKGKYPNMMSAFEIKKVMIDKGPDLTRLIDRLVEKGYVSRRFCANNRRKIEISILDAGMDILRKVEQDIKKLIKPFENLTDAEITNLNNILEKIRE